MKYFEEISDELGRLKLLKSNIHLAVFVEPYLSHVISGKKKIESRFSINKSAPYGQVGKGDIILVKKSGGPVIGYCEVEDVWYYQLNRKSLKDIRENYSDLLCIDNAQFWNDKRAACYATLIRINSFNEIPPFKIIKKDRRGWIVLKRHEEKVI